MMYEYEQRVTRALIQTIVKLGVAQECQRIIQKKLQTCFWMPKKTLLLTYCVGGGHLDIVTVHYVHYVHYVGLL